jgi:hypothetical protein
VILLLLAFAVYPGHLDVSAGAGQTVDLSLLLVGDEDVRVHATTPLELNEEITLSGARHVTLTSRIRANTPPGNHTSYLYVEPLSDDSVVVATAIPVQVAVQQPKPTRHRTIPNHTGWWAALGGVLTAIVGIAKAISVRKG